MTLEGPDGTVPANDGPRVRAKDRHRLRQELHKISGLDGIAAERLTPSVAWRFLELAAHQAGGDHATDLHRAIVSAAVRIGSTAEVEQSRLCRLATADVKSPPPATPLTITSESGDTIPW